MMFHRKNNRTSGFTSAFRSFAFAAHLLLGLTLVTGPCAHALEALDDSDLANVHGSGLAFVLENISANMGPQSYIEEVGSTPNSSATTFQQGNFYWFGLSLSGDTSTGQQWAPSAGAVGYACSTTATNSGTATGAAGNLGCAVGGSTATPALIANLAPYDNPYVLRVFPYTAPDENQNAAVSNTILELLGPTCVGSSSSASAAPALGCGSSTQQPSDTYRWSFWGGIVVPAVSGAPSSVGMLKDQAIIEGLPAAYLYPAITATTGGTAGRPNMYQGSVFRLFRTLPDNTTTNSDNSTLGLTFNSTLSGNFRFSVGQTGTTDADACTGTGGACTLANIGTVPDFDNTEGLYFRNVQAFLPLGQLHYQSIVFNNVGTVAAPNGNFSIELTLLPFASGGTCLNGDTTNPDCTNFYSLEAGDATGYKTAHDAQCTVGGGVQCGATAGTGNWAAVPTSYFQTHGYVQWGTGAPSTYGLVGCAADNGQTEFVCTSAGASDYGNRPYSPPAGCSGTACYSYSGDGIYFVSGNNMTQTYAAYAFDSDPNCSQIAGVCTGYKSTKNPSAQDSGNCAGNNINVCNNYYSSSGLNAVNIGTANIQGLMLQHLKFTTLGAQ